MPSTILTTCLLPLLLGAGLAGGGCATSSVESRKKERPTVYSELAPEQKAAVDRGEVRVGMSMDAVYLAWGKPAEVLNGETTAGATVTWLYLGHYIHQYEYWVCRDPSFPQHYYGGPYFGYGFAPVPYVKAEVLFEGGLVKEWHSLPRTSR